MSKKILISFSDTHGDWLETIRMKKGMTTIQDVVRDLVTRAYEKNMTTGE